MDGALDLLEEADRRFVRTPVPIIRPIAALKTRIRIAQGKITEALDWVLARDLSVDDDISYLYEFEHMTLARVLIAQETRGLVEGSIHDAKGLLERLLQAAEEGRRMGSVIEISVLLALAHAAQGDIPLALVSLERALTLAEPEGYVRTFVDEGKPIEELLRKAASRGIQEKYVSKLLAAFGETDSFPPSSPALSEQLSRREIEILRLIKSGMSNRLIAKALTVEESTIKTHINNLYSKLGVQSRTQAIARAAELSLL